MKSAAALQQGPRAALLTRIFQFQTDTIPVGAHPEVMRQNRDIRSVRLGDSERLLYHQDGDNVILLYADHHDGVDKWITRNRVQIHPRTKELQLWSEPSQLTDTTNYLDGQTKDDLTGPEDHVSEQVATVPVEAAVLATPGRVETPPFREVPIEDLLALGVPESWVAIVLSLPRIDSIEETLSTHVPDEVVDRLLAVALGEAVIHVIPPENHGDTHVSTSQFQAVTDLEELQRILGHPMAEWMAFLHPDQLRLVTGRFNGPVKVTGSAGTGKTVVAMHRARALARRGKQVLLTSFTNALCSNLVRNISLLCNTQEAQRIQVMTVDRAANRIALRAGFRLSMVTEQILSDDIAQAMTQEPGIQLTREWLEAEWRAVIDPNAIRTWEAYRDVERTGRVRPLTRDARRIVWNVFERLISGWVKYNKETFSAVAAIASNAVAENPGIVEEALGASIDVVIVDEVQDLDASRLRLVRAIAGDRPDSLMVVGDAGQRIYARPFSLRSCGIDVVGRSHVLRVNYRTSAQIRRFADKVNVFETDDLDSGTENRKGIRSILNGPDPEVFGSKDPADEELHLVETLRLWIAEGVKLSEIAVFVRTNARALAVRGALNDTGIAAVDLDVDAVRGNEPDAVTVTTLHRSKGLEYKAVAVVDAGDASIPLKSAVSRESEVDDLHRERDLLYVGMTRARDRLLVTWTGQPSRFLEDAMTAPGLAVVS